LEPVLKQITKNLSFEALFKREQKDPLHFKEGVANRCARVDRDAVGPVRGNFHLAFFAFAPQFEGKPHSHAAVNCVSSVLRGPLREKLYSKDKTGRLKVVSDDMRARGTVYTLHVYGVRRGTLFNRYYDPALVEESQPTEKLELKR
jgi:hypothetical protein